MNKEVYQKNREIVSDYFSKVRGILYEKTDDSKKRLEELQLRIAEKYSSKGICLDGIGDNRLKVIFSELKKSEDGNRGYNPLGLSDNPRGVFHVPHNFGGFID